MSIISFVPAQSQQSFNPLHNNAAFNGECTGHATQRRNEQSGRQNSAELSDSVFPSVEDLQGMNSRDEESDTVSTGGGWGVVGGPRMSTREKPDKLIEKARRLEERRHGNNPSI